MFTKIKNNKGFSLIETALVLLVVSASIFAFVSINNLQVQKTALENYSKDIASTYQTFLDAFIKYVQKVNPATSTTYTCTTIKADPDRFLPDSFPCTDSFGQSLKGRVSFKNGVIYSYFVYGDPGSVNVSNYLNAFNIKIPVQLINFFIQTTGNLSDINKKFLVIQNRTTIYQTTPTGYATASAFDIFGDDNTFISSLPIFNFAGQNYTIGLWSLYVASGVYTFRRVDLTNATSDYNLQVGEEAIIYFDTTQSTTKNLRIATNEGLYQMFIWAKYDTSINNYSVVLYPNNQSYSNAFKIIGLWLDEGTYLGYGTGTASGFGLGRIIEGGLLLCYFSTYRLGKFMIAWHKVVGSVVYGRLYYFVQRWDNTTTPWSSLGTINVAGSRNGTLIILVRRLL